MVPMVNLVTTPVVHPTTISKTNVDIHINNQAPMVPTGNLVTTPVVHPTTISKINVNIHPDNLVSNIPTGFTVGGIIHLQL